MLCCFFDNIEDPDEVVEANIRPSLLLPGWSKRTIDTVMEDESKTPLMVNRAIYRAHREMRLAVMDASKRFEENQRRRELEKKLQEQGKGDQVVPGPEIALVMRRGTMALKPDDSELQRIAEQEALDTASSRAGRPRRNRKKTSSDITGMFAKE